MKARAGIGISIVIAFLAALTIASSPRGYTKNCIRPVRITSAPRP